MEKRLAISINIAIPEELSEFVLSTQKRLLQKGIIDLRTYDTTPHLTILTKFLKADEIQIFNDAVNSYLSALNSIYLDLDDFKSSTDSKYIFLEFEGNTFEQIVLIRKELLKITKNIGWETIDELPPKHPYIPHVTVVKLDPHQLQSALQVLTYVPKREYCTDEIYITQQLIDPGGKDQFVIVERFKLL